ncbi:MAG: hypothetical protein AB7O24_30095 [Kofleriaceae bacterium]
MIRIAIILMLIVAACRGEHRNARELYNQGVAALATEQLDEAKQHLLEARNQAGVDPELRFRAAYDLGVTLAAQAEKAKAGEQPDLVKARELTAEAKSWFGDALALRKDDADTKANLAIIRARLKALDDEILRDQGGLEARLAKLIVAQRKVLDGGRAAWMAIKQAGGVDPTAQSQVMSPLADEERGITAEAGVLVDLSADEIDAIGKKPDDKRTDEEKVRVVQLKNVEQYLIDARTRLAEARRKLQELAAEDGVNRAEAALVALKRAREQMLDPINILRDVAQDQTVIMQETTAASGHASLMSEAPAEQGLPAWLEPPTIGARQATLRERLEQVRARMSAATSQAAPSSPSNDPQADAKRAKLIERITAALPPIGEASTAMQRAHQALADRKTKQALEDERTALLALARAIEQFSDLKQTIELAHAEQQQLVALLSPEAAKQLTAAERGKATRDGLARNTARMPRLRDLIADEVAQLAAQDQQLQAQATAAQTPAVGAGSGSAGGAPATPDPAKQLEQAKQQLEQAKQQLARAEELRGQAQIALEQLAKAIAANKDPLTPAKEAAAKLEELRKLFFSVIEHLKQLIVDQGETRDQTSVANAEDQFTREPKFPTLLGRQDQHAQIAKAIREALAAQADAAGKAPQQQPGGPDPKTLSAAAEQVRLAEAQMSDANGTLVKARDTKTSSESLTPAVDSQVKALGHLQAALDLLQPPDQNQQNNQDQQQQQQQQQDQAKQDKDKDKDKQQQQPAGGAGQRVRDEDAKRRRQNDRQPEPVEQDW